MQFDVAGALKAGATPDQIAQFLAQKQGFDLDGALGAGASVDQVIGFLAKPAKEPESRHIGAVLNDTVISIANAAAGGVAAAGDAISPGNRFSKFIDENIVKAGEASQSDVVKAGREKFQREVAAADGLGGEAVAAGRYLAENPLQAAGQAIGSFAGPGLAIKGARGVAGLLGLGARGTVAAGTAAGVATGAAMGGGDAGGEAYDLVMATPDDVLLQNDAVRAEVAKGRTLDEVKEEAAVSAARKASVLPAIAGGVSGAFGVERFLSGGKGFGGGLISRAVKSGLSEAVPEGLEEGLASYTGQAAAAAYDPSIDPMKGVGASATLGAALGLGPGMAAGVLDGVQSRRRAVAEQALQQATDAASAAAAANEMASVDLDAAVNEVEQAVSAYLRPDGGIPTPDQAMAQQTIETPQPLTPQEKQELARQQLQSTPVADPLAELRLQVNPSTTMADVAQRRDAVETSAIERMMAEDIAARPAAQEIAPPVATPAPDLAQASAQETTENQLAGLEQKTRERMVNQLMEAAAEPSGYFASRMIPAIDQQLAVLKQPPLTPQERERVVGLTGAAQAFTKPTLPEAPAPAIPDRGADNTSLEARIPEKIPRPSRILGQPTSSYTDDQLTRMIEQPDIPAVSRRGASIELTARQAAQSKAATLTNEGTMPQAAPVLEQPQAAPAVEQPQPQPAPTLEQPDMPAIQPQEFEQNRPPAQQKPAQAAGREGYDTPVELDAASLKAIIEQTRGEPLADKPAKMEAWRNGTAKTDPAKFPIELAFRPDGQLDVNDGRHRIALAAERGEKVTAFIDGKDAQRAQELVSQPNQPPDQQAPALNPSIKLNKLQQREAEAGGAGLAGELDPQVQQSLLAMRNNPKVPDVPVKRYPNGNISWSQADVPDFVDLGNGYSLRGYTRDGAVVQEIKLPNGMRMQRQLNKDGTISAEMEGDFRQIVEGQGFAEAKKLVEDFYANNGMRKALMGKAPAINEKPVPAQQTPAVAATETVAPTTPIQLGRDQTPLAEGGKPFKTRAQAAEAKKLQPMMRVVSVPGGYALAEKTAAQIAAQEKAAQRLRQARTSPKGEPIPAHAFIAANGGMQYTTKSDMGVDGNPRIGNRSLFAAAGRGLSIERATEMLVAEGYLSQGASHNDAYAIIKKSLTQPQYNADGIERIAEMESAAQFEDYLAAQEEMERDPWEDVPAILEEYTADELAASGYDAAPDAIKAEVQALLAMADARGIDGESILLQAHEQTRNATEQDYYEASKSALEAAIQGSPGNRSTPAGRQGEEGTSEGLTAPTRDDILASQDRASNERILQAREQIRRESEAGAGMFELTMEDGRQDTTGSLFDQSPSEPKAEPNPLELTPKQYADAWLRWLADSNGLPLTEVRELEGDEAGLKNIEQRWVDAVIAEAKNGQALPAKALDKLLGIRPNTTLPESAIPAGYQRPEGRRVEKERQEERRIDRAARRATETSPTAGVLANRKEQKANAFAQLKKVREQVKNGTANRLDLLKAETAHKDAVRYYEEAKAKLESERGTKLATPSDGRIVNSNAKLSTSRAPVPGSKHTVQDGETSHSFTVVDTSKLGAQGRLIQQIARIFGKRVVAFQSDTLQADGFVMNDDQTSIYLNVESTISPMAVFGHELTHQMKRDNPQAYAALEAVVQRNMDEEGMAKFRQEYGEEADIEELSSDLVGNRFREPAFWEDVFNEIAAQNPTGAAAIVQRVGQAIRKAVDTLLKTIRQQGFNADAYVTNLEEIRDAVRVAMVDYAKQQREPALAGVKDAPVVDGKAKFSNNRSAYDDIRRRLSDGRGIDDDSLLEFLAGQDRRKNARWGYVADRGGLPGVATIYWRGEVAGESGYYTAARFGRNGLGERSFMMGLFPSSELTDGSLRDVSRAFADRGYVWYLSAVQTKDGSWEVGTDGAEPGSKYRDALLERGEIAPAAGRYTRFTPKEVGLPNDLLREGMRRLSLMLGGKTPDVVFTRETGARPRDYITTIKADRLENRFSRRRNIFGQQVLPTWTAPTETKLDDFLYVMQDKMVDTKRVVEAVKGAIGRIDDQWNPYLQEELYHGRTATKTKQFLGDELRPLLQDMQSRGVGMADFEEYLHNRHAEERNQQIAKVNPGMPDGGSGIDTADARAYLAGLDPTKRRAYEALARRIDAITAGTRQLLVDNGLETQDTIDAWDAAYSQYVPLNREDLDFSSSFTSTGTGQGFSVKGAASKRATGSKRKVVDILANIAMQRERAIVRAEKNRVATAVYGLAASQPNTDFWLAVNPDAIKDPIGLRNELVKMGLNPLDAQNLIEEPTQTYIDPRTGLVSQRINPALRSSPNVLAVRVDGKDRYVFFNASDERSQRMVTALKNLDADQLGRVMGMAAQVTRWFASVNTQYNPIFGAINFMRDVQGAALQLSTTPIADMKAQVVGDVIPALRGIYADIRAERKGNARPGGAWATLWTEFQKEGAQTGYRDQFSKSAERAQALESELKRITEGKAKQFGRAMFDWLSDYNETMENAVRLAAYKAAKDKGLSNQQAASVAKNLTVNFNRKGQIATQAGALYAFFNAAIQGSTRLVQTLTGPAGKTIIGGGLLLGVIQAVMLAAAGYDDDEPPEFVRERSFIIPLPDGKYLTIPMPLGYNVIPNTSRVMTEFVLSGYRDPAKRVAQITGALLETFNPIGNAGWSVQTIAPTFADPLVALAENRDWTGKDIAKKDRSNTNPTPGYTRAKETASWFSKELSYYLNLASGGTKYKPGFLSPTPDQIDYLIGQVTGGVGREALKIEQTIASTVTGEELPPYKIPLAGRFYGDTKSASAESNRFYENITRLNEHENEIKGRRENRENPGEYLRENPEARLYQFANKIEQDVTKLRKRRRELLERGASKESIKMIETQITNRMKRLNDRVKAVQDAED